MFSGPERTRPQRQNRPAEQLPGGRDPPAVPGGSRCAVFRGSAQAGSYYESLVIICNTERLSNKIRFFLIKILNAEKFFVFDLPHFENLSLHEGMFPASNLWSFCRLTEDQPAVQTQNSSALSGFTHGLHENASAPHLQQSSLMHTSEVRSLVQTLEPPGSFPGCTSPPSAMTQPLVAAP